MQHRILIVRLSAVGDTILNLPVLCALRSRFPDAKIGWVVGTGAADILRGHPDLDDLFELSKADLKSLGSYLKFLSKIRAWKPNIVIDAQGLCVRTATIAGIAPSEIEALSGINADRPGRDAALLGAEWRVVDRGVGCIGCVGLIAAPQGVPRRSVGRCKKRPVKRA